MTKMRKHFLWHVTIEMHNCTPVVIPVVASSREIAIALAGRASSICFQCKTPPLGIVSVRAEKIADWGYE